MRTRSRLNARVVGEQTHDVVVDFRVAGHDRAVGERHVLGQRTTEQARLEQTPRFGPGLDALDPDATRRLALLLADDQFLRDVDETARQVARVRGAKGGVGEALAGAVRRDEVLEHVQTFTEVGLDRARDDLAARVRDQTAHTGDLTNLHDVSTSTRTDHHVDRVERRLRQHVLHGPRHLVGGVGPDLDLLLAPLVVGDDAAFELALDLGRFALELLEQTRPSAAAS